MHGTGVLGEQGGEPFSMPSAATTTPSSSVHFPCFLMLAGFIGCTGAVSSPVRNPFKPLSSAGRSVLPFWKRSRQSSISSAQTNTTLARGSTRTSNAHDTRATGSRPVDHGGGTPPSRCSWATRPTRSARASSSSIGDTTFNWSSSWRFHIIAVPACNANHSQSAIDGLLAASFTELAEKLTFWALSNCYRRRAHNGHRGTEHFNEAHDSDTPPAAFECWLSCWSP